MSDESLLVEDVRVTNVLQVTWSYVVSFGFFLWDSEDHGVYFVNRSICDEKIDVLWCWQFVVLFFVAIQPHIMEQCMEQFVVVFNGGDQNDEWVMNDCLLLTVTNVLQVRWSYMVSFGFFLWDSDGHGVFLVNRPTCDEKTDVLCAGSLLYYFV